jgi:hypothetical protein
MCFHESLGADVPLPREEAGPLVLPGPQTPCCEAGALDVRAILTDSAPAETSALPRELARDDERDALESGRPPRVSCRAARARAAAGPR